VYIKMVSRALQLWLMTKRVLGLLGAFWRRKVIEDAEQIAIWICRGKLVQTPRL
jgi:hypothetical protein